MTTRRPLVFYDKKHIWALITKTPAMVQMNSRIIAFKSVDLYRSFLQD